MITPAQFIAQHYSSDGLPAWGSDSLLVQHIGWRKRATAVWQTNPKSLVQWANVRKEQLQGRTMEGLPKIHTIISVGIDLPGVDFVSAEVMTDKHWVGLVEVEWVGPLKEEKPKSGTRWTPAMPVEVAQTFWNLVTMAGLEPVDPWEWSGWARTGEGRLVFIGELR